MSLLIFLCFPDRLFSYFTRFLNNFLIFSDLLNCLFFSRLFLSLWMNFFIFLYSLFETLFLINFLTTFPSFQLFNVVRITFDFLRNDGQMVFAKHGKFSIKLIVASIFWNLTFANKKFTHLVVFLDDARFDGASNMVGFVAARPITSHASSFVRVVPLRQTSIFFDRVFAPVTILRRFQVLLKLMIVDFKIV